MTRFFRCFMVLVAAAVLSLPLVSCGKKVALDPPPGSEYPKEYPSE